MNRRPVRLIAAVATLAVAAAAAVFAGSRGDESSPRLDALRADPLGQYEPGGGARLAARHLGKEGTSLGKPRAAEYDRWFALGEGDAEAQLDAAARAAREAGWELSGTRAGTAFTGRKEIAGGAASAVIGLRTDARAVPSGVAVPALQIGLER